MTNLSRIKRTILTILIVMIAISFVAVINLSSRVNEVIEAQNVLIEYIERGR